MLIKVFTFLYLISCICSFNGSITFPFVKRSDKLTSSINPLKEKSKNYLECEIEIGTPKQTIKLILEFYSNCIWIIQPNFKDYVMKTDLQNEQIPFYEDKSTTFNNKTSSINNDYKKFYRLSHCSKAKEVYDIFSFGNEKVAVDNSMFFLAEKITHLPVSSGILGLEFNNIQFSNIVSSGWINMLKKADHINQEVFYIDYLSDEKGELIIGNNQYLSNIQQDKNYGFKNINKSHWGLVFDKISYGDNAYSTKVQVIFKIEFGVIVAPEIYYQYIKKSLFNKYTSQCNEVYVEGTDFRTFTCNNLIQEQITNDFHDISFELNENFTTTLTSEDLFSINKKDGSLIFNVYFYIQGRKVNDNEWLVGEPFFKKNLVIFDKEKRGIGLYAKPNLQFHSLHKVSIQPNYQSTLTFPRIIMLMIITLFIIIIIIIKGYSKLNNKKKSNSEGKNPLHINNHKNESLIDI